ncbi:luciferin sulfotransferase-like [Frankliniella occidentalis]|uniref:Luciferin sulfotransferase-like n=1 Tax=Frankliniella occidentalis TaxID=133901 RepID=A0A9C6X964_FRAOC|nr:luciferin sulfotransferase-like [Frankliniella occidentalis]XP_052131396.1 luciferin sulfotransferase-like [Frankliniella occidentalis]
MPAVAPLSFAAVDGSDRVGRLLQEYFVSAFRKGYVQCGDKKVAMPVRYADLAQPILDLPIRDDDVWVVSHPKTGE